MTGIESYLDARVEHLSTGQRRLVELARVLAGPFDTILLDEPSSGLDATETENFGQILKRVVEEVGVGLLLVEHDMALVQQTCERVYVLDFGEMIFEGTAQEMLTSEVVRDGVPGKREGDRERRAGSRRYGGSNGLRGAEPRLDIPRP